MENPNQEVEEPMVQEEGVETVNPQEQKELDAYITGLSKLMHSKDTSVNVMEMLKSGEPEQTIPQVAIAINEQMEQAARGGGKPPSLDVLLNGGVFIVNDLIEMGNAGGVFQVDTEEQIAPILQSTIQTYIEQGLAKGTIDPVELQEKVGPLMNEEHTALGMEAAGRSGIPLEANQDTAMQAYGAQQHKAGMLKGGNV